jgi:hypothetical protein
MEVSHSSEANNSSDIQQHPHIYENIHPVRIRRPFDPLLSQMNTHNANRSTSMPHFQLGLGLQSGLLLAGFLTKTLDVFLFSP